MCNDPIETIDHLFFSCPVAKGVGATVYNQCCKVPGVLGE